MTYSRGPCEPWDAYLPCEVSATSPDITGYAVQAATEVLWALSGRQFGTCQLTLYPCRDECGPMFYPGYSYYADPTWLSSDIIYALGCAGGCTGPCGCNTVSRFTLPRPISSIVQITVDGEVVPSGSYQVYNHQYVVRTDGEVWPRCNNLGSSTAEGTWSVEVVVGAEVPRLGLLAAGELACEFIKAFTTPSECKLPRRLQTITRQGVAMAFIDPQTYLDNGLIGLYLADLFIASFNPHRITQPARIYSPDRPTPAYRT